MQILFVKGIYLLCLYNFFATQYAQHRNRLVFAAQPRINVMGIRSTLFATVAVLFSSAVCAEASTTTVNLPGQITGVNNNVMIYDSGTAGVGPGFNTNILSGTVGADETATFTYTLTGGSSFTGNSLSVSGAGGSNSTAPFNSASVNSTSNPLIFSNASFGSTGGFFTITNNSLGLDSFQAMLFGSLSSAGELIITLTSAVSNVPLPATASLFALGFALLAGVGIAKRKHARTEA
jgi:hypothetical protein